MVWAYESYTQQQGASRCREELCGPGSKASEEGIAESQGCGSICSKKWKFVGAGGSNGHQGNIALGTGDAAAQVPRAHGSGTKCFAVVSVCWRSTDLSQAELRESFP